MKETLTIFVRVVEDFYVRTEPFPESIRFLSGRVKVSPQLHAVGDQHPCREAASVVVGVCHEAAGTNNTPIQPFVWIVGCWTGIPMHWDKC